MSCYQNKQVNAYISAKSPDYIPKYHGHSAGCDIMAAIDEPIVLGVGEYRLIPSGFNLDIPVGVEVQVRPRSGLALKYGVTVLNAPGTIDSDYRGEVGVILINHGKVPFIIEPMMRVAQIVFARHLTAEFIATESLGDSERGANGFGSTGV
jgi:dUTP pyrophosphatase